MAKGYTHRKLPILPSLKARYFDATGRLNIPKGMRISAGMKDDELVHIQRKGKVIMISPAAPVCVHCEGTGEYTEIDYQPEFDAAVDISKWLENEADKLAHLAEAAKSHSPLDINRQRTYTVKVYRQIAQAIREGMWQ